VKGLMRWEFRTPRLAAVLRGAICLGESSLRLRKLICISFYLI